MSSRMDAAQEHPGTRFPVTGKNTGFPLCRLCEGPTSASFTRLIMGRYLVSYWRCETCGSLQTDLPTWLDEAYRDVHSATDTGMASRTLRMAQIVSLLLRVAGADRKTACLDWGGGNGLFCRMMRDQGYDFFSYDKYAEPFYSAGFTLDEAAAAEFSVVTTFEVFEHLLRPRSELGAILAFRPLLWIFSTQIFENQGADWGYLAPENGRHVFFYSEKALQAFGQAHGYRFLRGRHLHMFLRERSNPYLASPGALGIARRILAGGKLAGLSTSLHYMLRQHRAHLFWQSDSSLLKRRAGYETPYFDPP